MRVAQAGVDHLSNGLHLGFVLKQLAGAVGSVTYDADLPACTGLRQVDAVRELIQRAEFFGHRPGHDRFIRAAIRGNVDMIGDRGANDIAVVFLLLQAGNTNPDQHSVNLSVAEGSRPGCGVR